MYNHMERLRASKEERYGVQYGVVDVNKISAEQQ